MKCAKDGDIYTLGAVDKADLFNLVYEAKSECVVFSFVGWTIIFFHVCFFVILDCIVGYDMKLLDIDSDTLGTPETEYKPHVTMPSRGFTRIVPDLSQLGGGRLYRDQQGSR